MGKDVTDLGEQTAGREYLRMEHISKRFGGIGTKYLLMPSTSPANPRYDKSVWFAALSEVFADRNKSAK